MGVLAEWEGEVRIDLAKFGTASMSSTYPGGYEAFRAIDQVYEQPEAHTYCTTSDAQWLRVKLDQPLCFSVGVTMVTIFV